MTWWYDILRIGYAFNHTEYQASGNLSTGEVNTTSYPGKINNLNQLGGHGLAT